MIGDSSPMLGCSSRWWNTSNMCIAPLLDLHTVSQIRRIFVSCSLPRTALGLTLTIRRGIEALMKRPVYDLPARAMCYRQNYLQIFVGWNSLPCRLRASKVEQLDSE